MPPKAPWVSGGIELHLFAGKDSLDRDLGKSDNPSSRADQWDSAPASVATLKVAKNGEVDGPAERNAVKNSRHRANLQAPLVDA